MTDARGSERAVIGSCCAWPDRIAGIDLTPGDFEDPRCAAAFRAALDDPEGFDCVVAAALPGVGEAFIRACMDTAVSVHELDGHCRRVKQAARLRRLREGMDDALRASPDADSLADALAGLAENAKAETGTDAGIDAAVKRLFDRWDADEKGIGTGFPALDGLTGGFRPGQFIILAARPGVGKSAMAAQIAAHMAQEGRRVLFFSLEMQAEDQAARLIAARSGAPLPVVANGSIGDDADLREHVLQAAVEVAGWPVRIDDSAELTVEDIRRRTRAFRPDAVIVDYVGLIATPGRGTKNDEIAAVSRALKQMAGRLRIPVIALCQLNRAACAMERPQLSSLRDSGSLEQDADLVLLLWRCGEGRVKLSLEKNRQGPTGEAEYEFLAEVMRFREESLPEPDPLPLRQEKLWHELPPASGDTVWYD